MGRKPDETKTERETKNVARETKTSYEKASNARDDAAKDMAKEGFLKGGSPSKDFDPDTGNPRTGH